MAGLTAGLSLLRRGHKVTVIEYQNRVGGRLLSEPLGDGMFTEAGGGHFRSNMPYVLAYIRHYGLPLLSLNDGLPRYIVGETGTSADLAGWPWKVSPEERNVTASSSLNRYLFQIGLDTDTVLDSRWPDPDMLDKLSDITLRDLLINAGASEIFCKLLNAHGGTFTTDPQALSAIPAWPIILVIRISSASKGAIAGCPRRSRAPWGRTPSFSIHPSRSSIRRDRKSG